MIRVLIVDDSNVIKKMINNILEKEPEIEIAGFADNGIEAYEKTFTLKPDIILMDIRMPKLGGLDATKMIMKDQPTPVIILTAILLNNELTPSEVLESGAVSLIEKPKGFDYSVIAEKLIKEIKSFSKMKFKVSVKEYLLENKKEAETFVPWIVCIGASTGGPDALAVVLADIPLLKIPIVIVQHITSGFSHDLAKWLQPVSKMKVKVAEDNESLQPGVIYLPTDDKQLIITPEKKCFNSSAKLHAYICPSVDITFESVLKTFGKHTMGILLTGMGKDGAESMKKIFDAGGYTIAQNEESSVVFGMPKAAINKNGVTTVLPLNKIGQKISSFFE